MNVFVKRIFLVVYGLSSFTLNAQYRTETIVGGGVLNNLSPLSSIRPGALASGLNGEILIADGNSFIWRYTGASLMTRIIGSGISGFNGNDLPALESHIVSPPGLARFDGENIVFLDNSAFQIRLWNKTTGKIERLAGDGTKGFTGDGGNSINARISDLIDLAIDSLGNILFIDGPRVRKINRVTRVITTIAGNGSTSFSGDGGLATQAGMNPSSLTVDRDNNVFIYDGARVRLVNPSGIISTYAGNGVSGATGDGGIATSARIAANVPFAGARLAVDHENNLLIGVISRIRKVDRSTRVISTIAGTVSGYDGDGGPASLAKLSVSNLRVTSNGDIIFSQPENSVIRRINREFGTIETIAGNGKSGYYSGDGPIHKESLLSDPWAVVFDASQSLYVASVALSRVFKMNSTLTSISTIAGDGFNGFSGDDGPALNARLNGPISLAIDKLNRLYIADQVNHRIRRIDLATGVIKTIAGTGGFTFNGDNIAATQANINRPGGLICDSNNNLYLIDRNNFRIRKIDFVTGLITTIAGNGIAGYSGDGGLAVNASIQAGRSLCFDPDGNLYFSDTFNHVIRKIVLSTGIITTIAGTGEFGFSGDGALATQSRLYFPAGITFDNEGRLLISDSFNNRIRRVDSSGIIETIAGNGKFGFSGEGIALNEEFSNPRSIAINSDGDLFVAESSGERVRSILFDPTLSVSEIPPPSFSIFPNPVIDDVYIKTPWPSFSAEIFNPLGYSVFHAFESNSVASFNLKSLPAGLYVLKVKYKETILIERIVKH